MISAIIGPHDIKKGAQQMLRGVIIDKKVILKNDDLCPKAFRKRSLLRQELPKINAGETCFIVKVLL